MAVYFVTGKLGSGKSLVCVGKIQEYLQAGKPVATNLDINIEKLVGKRSKTTHYRIPDKPRISDLELIGYGNNTPHEEDNGLLVLDECGTWLNARTWNDKERQSFIDWMLHARKFGWDVLFIIQDIGIVDKQLKLTLCEHLVICRRLDRLPIPVLSSLVKMFSGLRLTFPKIHRAKVHYGESEQDLVADKWTYRARYLYDAYDTRQVFIKDEMIVNDETVDMRATYTALSRWHLEGRYLPAPFKFPVPKTLLQFLLYPSWLIIFLVLLVVNAPTRSVGALSR